MKERETALITGASGGIGLEFAKLFAAANYNLVLVARSEGTLLNIKKQLENTYATQVNVFCCDLSKPNSAQHIFDYTKLNQLNIDVLVNNAGIGGHGLFHERELNNEQAMIQLNVTSLTELTHLYLQGMVQRKRGKVLNVSSTVSFLPGPLQAVYYATKAYVTSFSLALSEELKHKGVSVTALCPGPVATGFVKAGDLEGVEIFKKAKSAKSVAEIGFRALNKKKIIVFNEFKLSVLLNWITPLLPRKLVLSLSRQSMEKQD